MTALATDGMTMMVVTHEMGFARRVASRVVFMDMGEVVQDCPADEFFQSSAVPAPIERSYSSTRYCLIDEPRLMRVAVSN